MSKLMKFSLVLMITGAIAIIAPTLYCAFKADPMNACMVTGLILFVIGALIFLIHCD